MKDPAATTTHLVHEKRKKSNFEGFDSTKKCAKVRDNISTYRPEETAASSARIGNSCGSLDLNSFASSTDWDSNASFAPPDLTSQDVGSSANQDSSNDPLRKWKEMKENGFLSPSHSLLLQSAVASSAQIKPRKKTQKKKTKMEIMRKEPTVNCHVNSSPSALLSGLNVGIINHVRNKKQVHSIIKALVNPEGGSSQCTNEHDNKTTAEEDKESTDVSLKAANVAAQWLELLNQDIKGRLSALRQSRNRVCAVITSELPRLFPKEKCSDEFHFFRWENLFREMENVLSEEEKQLECWLCDVKEMQSQLESSENCDERDKEFAVMAAAASIYSSSNFLMSNENGSCFLSSH